jgi:hypothetical protein
MAIIPSYYEGLLSEDDMSSLRLQSLASGLLGAGAAFSRAGAPSLMPQGGGFSEALQGFNQGYQGQLDSALQNMLKATQVQELVRKQKEAQQLKQLYASAATPKYQTIAGAQTPIPSDVNFEYPAVTQAPSTQKLVGYDYDLSKIIPQLQRMGLFGEAKNIAETTTALRESGLIDGGSTMKPSDIAGQVKEAIQTLGIKDASGRLKTPDKFTDEDRARVATYISSSDVNKSPKINVSDPTAVAKAQSENVKDFNTQIKDFREVGRRYNAMVEAHKDKANPATDSTLIYGLAKIYDPAGAVQQGDIATIKGKRSIPQSVVGLADRIGRGGTLTEQERDNVISTAYSMVNSYSKSVQSDVDTYRSFSKSFGADPNQIKNPFESLAKPDYIFVTVGGKQAKATKAKDGAYYIQRGDQYYKVSD